MGYVSFLEGNPRYPPFIGAPPCHSIEPPKNNHPKNVARRIRHGTVSSAVTFFGRWEGGSWGKVRKKMVFSWDSNWLFKNNNINMRRWSISRLERYIIKEVALEVFLDLHFAMDMLKQMGKAEKVIQISKLAFCWMKLNEFNEQKLITVSFFNMFVTKTTPYWSVLPYCILQIYPPPRILLTFTLSMAHRTFPRWQLKTSVPRLENFHQRRLEKPWLFRKGGNAMSFAC